MFFEACYHYLSDSQSSPFRQGLRKLLLTVIADGRVLVVVAIRRVRGLQHFVHQDRLELLRRLGHFLRLVAIWGARLQGPA
jgi:hypothetical protein